MTLHRKYDLQVKKAMLKLSTIPNYGHKIPLKSRSQNQPEVDNWLLKLDIVLISSSQTNLYRLMVSFGILC